MIELRTLGGIELRCSNGGDVKSLLSRQKPLALLAYLAIGARRGFQTRDYLAGLLWSEADRDHGRDSLGAALRIIRRCLGNEVLVVGGDERMTVNPERVRCDAVEFEDALDSDLLDSALKLYSGDLLEGFAVEGASGFQIWLEAERARLRSRAERAKQDRAARYEFPRTVREQREDESLPVITPPSIPGYVIDRELGRGGAAVVYLARDTKHGRDVAVKVLKPEFTGSIQQLRFAREIRHVAKFSHPHIVPLIDSGHLGDVHFYVTPYIAGESLRRRLERERQLDVSDAVRIVSEVAEGLDYAHRLDVVHRDVKPENILLADGHAQIADFGLALATSGTTSGKLTDSGIAVGTPHYVSPEQGAGARDVDKRSDVYSLGCVLYELLTGSPPFTGVTPQQIVAQHMTAPVPSLRLRRPGIAPRIERAVLKALAKTPADRFRTALAFSEACSGDSRPSTWWRDASEFLSGTLRTPRGVAAATVVALSATTVWGLTREGATRTSVDNASFASATPAGVPREAEPTRYAIVGGSGRNAESLDDVAQLLHDALRRWSGITILGNQEVRDALSRVPGGPTAGQAAQRAAMALSADYYVRLAVSRSGDSLGVRATLFEARSNSALKDGSVRIAPTLRGAGPAMNMLADSLLFREGVPPLRVEPTVGTRSLRARQAYARGHTALEDWDLARADAEFFAATREDAQYAQAFLWLAQVRSWLGRPVTSWEFAAEHAAARGDELAERERILSRALLSLARGERHKACPLWGQLTDHDPTDFAAWYAWGNCLRSDDAVVVDPRSPSGWRFRTSYHTALRAYRRAFQLRPAIHRSFAGGSLDDIRRLLVTGSNAVRQGRAVRPDTTRFSAYPSWQGDTLAFIPVPLQEFASLDASSSESRNIATRRQRELFQEIASMWRAAYPHSVDAIEAVAVALDLLGNSSALDTLQFARRRAADIDDRVRMGGLEVWMRVKSAAPSNVARLRTAARLADSLLSHHTPADAREAKLFASLAALLGRATQAARYGRMAAARTAPPDRPIPVAIAETAPALVAFAALGGPVDSVRTLEALVIRSIGNDVEDTDRDIVRAEWLFRSAILAVPTHRSPVISELARSGSMTGKLLQAWSVGDLARARQLLAALRDYRRQSSIRPPDITLDGLYPEAAAMASLGDARAAIEWLDPTLDSLAFMAPQSLADVARAGPFVRAMVLRAELADRVNDRTKARTWAHAVTILWSHPDEFLKPTLSRMRSLAR